MNVYAGIGDCPDCHVRVLFAMDADGELVALDTGPDGPVVVRWDCTDTPRVRACPPGWRKPKGVDEHRFGLHRESCAALARVHDIGSAPSAVRRAARSGPARRTASAR